ncbi:MAG: ShlB/FhaC/HecB family hemolysin secretion/activation protein [Cyanobacteria bacterium SIG31]|nr:ShlB/FhaC/HecB family hemolysin secretion/activation protein [Cyanobacteria bacterium SIG31]
MKKQLSYLLMAMLLLTTGKANADAMVGTVIDASGTYNRMQLQQVDGYKFEKSYVHSLEHVTKDESIYDASVEENVAREGVLYNPHFLLEKINFEGNTKISDEELEKLALEILGEDIFFDELLEVCSKVTNLYHAKGFLTSYATVPPQRIVDGVATIKIVESKVGELNIEGEKWTREWYLRNIIMGKAGLREGDVFNAKNLQRAMKEINREDYVQIQTDVERQSIGDENTAITLNVRDRFPVNLGFSYDDYGRSYTGAQRVSFLVGMDNLTGLGDKIYGGTILSSGATGWMAGYSLPVSPYGTRLSFDFTDSHVRLGGPYKSLGIKGSAQSYFFKLTHPLVQTAKSDLFLYSGYDFVNASTYSRFTGNKSYLSDYHLHVWRSGLYGMTDDDYGRWIGSLGLDFGLSGKDKAGSNADTTFFKMTASATRVQRLFARSMGIVRVSGQYSPNELFAAEQMQLGGPYTLRGYQPAELIGDYGVSGTLEYRFPVPFLDRALPWLDERMRLAVFYDWGIIGANGNYSYPGDKFLHSIGFGTYLNLTDWVTAQVGLGFPFGNSYNENTARFYFSINSDLDRLIPLRNPEKI